MKKEILYRKARKEDLEEIATLVTQLLGTCSINKNDKKIKTDNEIFNENKTSIKDDIERYFVCEKDGKVIGACRDK